MICEECGQPFAPSGRGKKAKYCSAKCKQRAYRRAKRMSRVTTPPAPAGDAEHEPEAMDALTAADFEAMMNDGPEDYVSVLKRTQARLKEAMFSAGTLLGAAAYAVDLLRREAA